MTKTATLFTLASVVILTGCPKKGDSVDAAAEGAAATADTSTATADTSTAAATAPTTTGGGTVKTTPKVATDAGAGEAGAGDGGTMADGGAADQCCCDVGGKKEMAGQSACVKDKKGACVKREMCAAVDAGASAATTPDAGASVQQCCCDVGGKKELAGQSACVKEKKGACVKMDQCKAK